MTFVSFVGVVLMLTGRADKGIVRIRSGCMAMPVKRVDLETSVELIARVKPIWPDVTFLFWERSPYPENADSDYRRGCANVSG